MSQILRVVDGPPQQAAALTVAIVSYRTVTDRQGLLLARILM
jgi:hypothetical protein